MLKIFRNVRRNLIGGNRLISYLIYAIGEIILVVIGILIALQVNNWNAEQKLRIVEIKILNDIDNDLKDNIANLRMGIEALKVANNNSNNVLELYQNKTTYHDSLIPYFIKFTDFWDPDFTYAGFENLKNLGMSIISNEELRKEIVNTEVQMEILDGSQMTQITQLNGIIILPLKHKYFARNMSPTENFGRFIPTDYESMLNDKKFYNDITEISYRQSSSLVKFKAFIKNAETLSSKIEAEIENLKK